jgi:hypothetical protein
MTEAALEELLPVGDRFAVRVMVTDAWDQVVLAATSTTTVAEMKRLALAKALKSDDVPADEYIVKFHGGRVLDESVSLAAAGAGPNAPFIVLPARRRPVR